MSQPPRSSGPGIPAERTDPVDRPAPPAGSRGYVVAASLPDRATVARLVEVEATGFRLAGPARIHTYRAGSLMLTDHGTVADPAGAVLEGIAGGAERAAQQWRPGIGDGAVIGASTLPDTVEGFVVADGHLWSVSLTGAVGSVGPTVIVERLLRTITGEEGPTAGR